MASTIVVDKLQATGGVVFTLPTADGSAGHLLKTNGSAVLSFTADTGILNVVEDTTPQLGGDLSCNSSQIQWSKGADVSSATALVLLTDGNYFDVTGTVTITSFNTTAVGTQIKLHFDAACILTHHTSDLILPSGASITTVAGDEAEFIEYASGDYRCTNYTRADGSALTGKLNGYPVTDHTANGPQTNTFASGYGATVMDLVYMGGSSKWLEADADAATAAAINLLGISLESKTDTQAMNVALSGSFVKDASWSFTPGVPLYMDTTDGGITATKPTGSGDAVRTVGYAVHANYIFFAPSSDYVTLA